MKQSLFCGGESQLGDLSVRPGSGTSFVELVGVTISGPQFSNLENEEAPWDVFCFFVFFRHLPALKL